MANNPNPDSPQFRNIVGDAPDPFGSQYRLRDLVEGREPYIPTVPDDETMDAVLADRMRNTMEVIRPRVPATALHYPAAQKTLVIQSGINENEISLDGNGMRALQIQNVGSLAFLWCAELNMYLSASLTPMATFNFPQRMEKISLEWHTSPFNRTPPPPVPGETAIIWIYDDWVPPVSGSAGGGGSSGGALRPSTASGFLETADEIGPSVILPANVNRYGATITNLDTSAVLIVLIGGVPTAYLSPIVAGVPGYWELPFGFTGDVAVQFATTPAIALDNLSFVEFTP